LVLTPPNFWSCIWAYMYLGYSGSSIGPLFTFDFNFMPTILKWWSGSFVLGDWVKTMLVGNVLLFVPMGFFLPIIFGNITKHKFFRIAIMLPIAIEVVQPMIGRSFDVDDIICNFAGMLIGYGFALMIPCFIHKTA